MKQLMFSLITYFLLLIFPFAGQADMLDPVEWDYSVEKVNDTKYKLIYKASLDKGWHLYSQNIKSGGPIPTSFDLDSIPALKKAGKVKEIGEMETAYDENFQMELKWFSDSVRFEQVVELSSADVDKIKGELEFMVCDDKRCLPPETEEFSFSLTNKQSASPSSSGMVDPIEWDYDKEKIDDNTYMLTFAAHLDDGWYIYSQHLDEGGPVPTTFTFNKDKGITLIDSVKETSEHMSSGYDSIFGMELTKYAQKVEFQQKVELSSADQPVTGKIEFMVCDDKRCLPPETTEFAFNTNGKASSVNFEGGKSKDQQTLYGIFIAGLAGGFVALLTPCVFPMIPLTVSFFTKSSPSKFKGIMNAMIYGLSIIIIYVGLGFLVTKMFGASSLNEMASNIWFNLAFFLIFIIFAISLFGAFELTLPTSWSNKADELSDKGGFIGIFFMAFTLAVVSFSCTGPIIGPLLVQSAVMGNNIGPLLGMGGFSLALALPFTLFAIFPGWLNTLPKSGGWMNTVKVTLGFLELGLALKFLSNVDMAYGWGILPREIFLGLWMLIALALALYLFGVYKFPSDSPLKKLSIPRVAFGLFFLAFAGYAGSGIAGNTLHYLSGFPPPSFYSVWDTKDCPQNFNCFHDYEEALAHAKQVNKPLMLDFTGWSCVNCRKMEENVWIKPEIKRLIEEKYVLVSLYVDEKEKLPKRERYVSDFSGEKIITVGKKWSDFQASRFGAQSQPYYVLMAPDKEEVLIEPRGYTPDVSEYKQFLEKGLKVFQKDNKLSYR